jgi:hypothetical protein
MSMQAYLLRERESAIRLSKRKLSLPWLISKCRRKLHYLTFLQVPLSFLLILIFLPNTKMEGQEKGQEGH